jgi:hypothetical protein
MAYHRTEYNRDEDRDNKTGGWRSWFGLDNKDRDDDNRGYNYQSTTTYRNPQSSSYHERSTYPERGPSTGGYTGTRGGYGYTTSDEVTRGGPSWTTDRDYTTRPSYGQPMTGDRDTYYRQETRTYGGDRDQWTRPTGDYTSRSYTPSRSYGITGDRDYTTRDYTTTSRDYPTTSRDYPTTTPSRGYTTDYPTTRGYPTYGREDTTPSRGYGFTGERDWTSSRYPTTGDRDWTTSRYTTNGDRTTGYRGDYTGGDSTYTRPSYQSTSYRY